MAKLHSKNRQTCKNTK